MNVLKKSVLTFLTISSSVVFAGTMGPICKEGNATIPCPMNAWELGVQALYLHANYVNGVAPSFYEQNGIAKWNIPDPGWGWGFRINGGYYYDQGSDLNFNWSHLNYTNQTLVPTSVITTAGPPYASVLDTQILKPRWDAVNGELGQLVHFGDHKSIRFHGGAQFSQIVSNLNFPAPSFPTESTFMKFYGFGPRFGADMKYHWAQGLSIYANGATALLVGGSKFNTTSSGLINPSFPLMYIPYTTAVIPELEGKLGASYTYVLSQGHITLDAGYWWLNYINSQTNGFQETVKSSDFTLNGPYFGVKWLG